ncbi:MAG: SufD family Fe-S cluster assembly protein [Sulfolobales archaeon]|nr:SufD family Fe-S cluster assembly protein [Sulfolobales archaeon]MCX8209062.1 SufD family Fe-S cluster assembly protein [Sulfolobales archaeon]MDW8009983.1 SufD family Fe-S cluster assembly protein [Sulfolobales archaeon]
MSRDEVLKALSKPSPYGPDVDLGRFSVSDEETPSSDVSAAEKIADRLGIGSWVLRKADYLQVNESVVARAMSEKLAKYGAVVLPTREALRKLSWAPDYAWKLVEPTLDKYVAATYLYGREAGFFIYVPPDAKVREPIYTCLFITRRSYAQLLHNIVVVDDGAELNLITGCGVPDQPVGSLHVGISEYYVGRKAKLTYTMIHAWAPDMVVRPRTVAEVREGGEYVSYYVIYSPVESLQTFPRVILRENARATLNSVVVGGGRGVYDVGSSVVLSGAGSSGEILSRNLGRGSSAIYARSRIRSTAGPSKGHIECLGLIEGSEALIESLPEISSSSPDAVLTHEAAIGKIGEELISYLMSKGFAEDEARSVIIKGFLSIEEPKLPPQIMDVVRRTIEYIASRATG